MKPQLIVALDVPSPDQIGPIVDALPDEISMYKIGLEIFVAAGPAALTPLKKRGKQIFLDLKLHDIPRTVANAVTTAATHGVSLLTIHAGGGPAMIRAAADAAAACGDDAPQLVAVTTLTSLDQDDLTELGVNRQLGDHTSSLGQLAIRCGADGLVCSALEVKTFRENLGPDPILVTPGIRMAEKNVEATQAGNETADQKRIATPAMAIRDGSSHLVVGRPIIKASDPRAAAVSILEEMRAATA